MRVTPLLALIACTLGLFRKPLHAAAQEVFQAAPDALESVSWRTRTQVGSNNLTAWRFGLATTSVPGATFLEALTRAHAVRVNAVEASASQRVSRDIRKNLDQSLTAGEREVVNGWLEAAELRMLSYRVESLGADAASRRAQFDLAKALNVEVIVVPFDGDALGDLERLANDFEVTVALLGDPRAVMEGLQGRGERLTAAADLGMWMEAGIRPIDGLGIVADRLRYVSLRDRSALGADARNVMLGQGAGNLTELFHELNRRNLRPLTMALNAADVAGTPAQQFAAVEAFEEVVQPAYGSFFTDWSLTRTFPIGDLQPSRNMAGEDLSALEVRRRIARAVLTVPVVQPLQPRKLLVIESLHGMYHNPGIPEVNLMIDLMGKTTGAWETEFSNDLSNLKWPRIAEYDAVFVNSAVNEMFPDPAVRESLTRFVREGGGLGGIHGTPWASRNWEEFAQMIGARSAPHRIEMGVMKAHDPGSPIMQSFGTEPLLFREEYYRFEHDGYNRLRWEDVRVLLTVELDDPQVERRPWDGYRRPDNVYPVTWVRQYGQGRVFYSSLGHMAETFYTPPIVGHLFAGLQFILGDLEVDTTPNPPTASAP